MLTYLVGILSMEDRSIVGLLCCMHLTNSVRLKSLIMKKVRLNMHDAFTGALHSIEKDLSLIEIETAERLMVNGSIRRVHNKKEGITYDWIIDEVEILD